MDLGLHRRRRHQTVEVENLSSTHTHDLSLYREAPKGEINLTEFEDYAIERLKLLRIIDHVTNKGIKPFTPEYKAAIMEELQKQELKRYIRLLKSNGSMHATELDYQARKADHISHYILRLAYCRSAELKRWFITKELDLFKMRFMELTPQAVVQFFKVNNLHYDGLTDEESIQLRDDLVDSTSGLKNFDTTTFYKVPYLEVLNLIRTRKVFLKAGMAYVPSFDMVTCITSKFRSELNEYLAYACRKLPEFEDERVLSIVSNLNQAYVGNDFENVDDKNEINIQKIDALASKHFPLCMKNIHDVLRCNHHLKHGCRVPYVMFLKGIGVTLDDCLRFWREEFTKLMPEDKFEKTHAYNIRHAYGKVGRMVSYTPYSCMKIITTTVGPGEQHGCPYRHWDSSILKKRLEDIGIYEKYISEILEFSKNGHYQLACGKYFEAMHGSEPKMAINHPNQYFQESYDRATNKAPKEVVKSTPSKINKKPKVELSEAELSAVMDDDF